MIKPQQYIQQQQKYKEDEKDVATNINNDDSINNEHHHHKHDVIGVDISNDRLSISKNIIRKYQINNRTKQDDDNSQNNDNEKSNNNNNDDNVNIRLYCNDGTTFGQQKNNDNVTTEPLNLVFELHTTQQQNEIQQQMNNNKRKRMNKSARSRERQLLKQLSNIDQRQSCCQLNNKIKDDDDNNDDNIKTSMKLFDRVLIDAECSTDASMKHLSKRLLSLSNNKKKQQKNVPPAFYEKEVEIEKKDDCSTSDRSYSETKIITLQHDNDNDTYIQNLITLQKKLIQSGFLLFKSNGIMVHSTCSLSYEQNEYIVDWLLKQYPNTASLISVTFHNTYHSSRRTSVQNSYIQEGSIKGTIRFLPNVIYNNNDKEKVVVSSSDCDSIATTINSQDTDLHDLYRDGFFLAKIRKKI